MSSAALIGSVCSNVKGKKKRPEWEPAACSSSNYFPTNQLWDGGESTWILIPLLCPQVLKIPHIAAEKQSTCICDTYFYHSWEGIFHAFAFWAE